MAQTSPAQLYPHEATPVAPESQGQPQRQGVTLTYGDLLARRDRLLRQAGHHAPTGPGDDLPFDDMPRRVERRVPLDAVAGILARAGFRRGLPAGTRSSSWEPDAAAAWETACDHCGHVGLALHPYVNDPSGARVDVLCCFGCGAAAVLDQRSRSAPALAELGERSPS